MRSSQIIPVQLSEVKLDLIIESVELQLSSCLNLVISIVECKEISVEIKSWHCTCEHFNVKSRKFIKSSKILRYPT